MIRHYILVGNRRYDYTLAPSRGYTTIHCEGAGISARIPNEEVPMVLARLAKEIMSAKETAEAQSEVLRFRVTPSEKQLIEQSAVNRGFNNVSAYLRHVALQDIEQETNN